MLPCILHWNQNHFVILQKISKNIFTGRKIYKIIDPGHGILTISEDTFHKSWTVGGQTGIALLLEPTDSFYNQKEIKEEDPKLVYLLKYIKPFKNKLFYSFYC